MPNAEPTSTTTEQVEGNATEPTATEPTQPDALAELQAKYDALLESSRKWEGRSKANAEKAKAYDALAQQTADAQAAADEAKADAAKLKDELAAANRSLAVSCIAAEKGVDADILAAMAGDDADAIAANADAKLGNAVEQNGDAEESVRRARRGGAGCRDDRRSPRALYDAVGRIAECVAEQVVADNETLA